MWVQRFIYFHDVRHPAEMAESEINAFLHTLGGREICQRIHPESGTESPSLSLPERDRARGEQTRERDQSAKA